MWDVGRLTKYSVETVLGKQDLNEHSDIQCGIEDQDAWPLRGSWQFMFFKESLRKWRLANRCEQDHKQVSENWALERQATVPLTQLCEGMMVQTLASMVEGLRKGSSNLKTLPI